METGRSVVVSQPMYFPWVGQLEQLRLSNAFVFYDDVQFARGFFNRVQIKTAAGIRWLTVPLKGLHRGQLICEATIDDSTDWRRSHRDGFRQAYADAAFLKEALALMDSVLCSKAESLAELSMASTRALAQYFGLDVSREFSRSSSLGIVGQGTQRLVDICTAQQADTYLTGHGARDYLDCEAFEAKGIDVVFIEYGCLPYDQSHGVFTPYVSTLDLVAHCGPGGLDKVAGRRVPWREFMHEQAVHIKE